VMASGDRLEANRAGRHGSGDLPAHACGSQRTKRVSHHAFGLMSNLYHLLLEAPQANLSLGWVGCRTRSRDGQARGMSFAVTFLGTLQRNFDRGRETAFGRSLTIFTSIRCERELLRRKRCKACMMEANGRSAEIEPNTGMQRTVLRAAADAEH